MCKVIKVILLIGLAVIWISSLITLPGYEHMAITIGLMLIVMTWLFVCNKIKLASELDLNYKAMFAWTTLLFL